MLYIHGMGHFHPDNVIDNAFLEDLGIETNNEWIVDRVGIHTRRTVLDLDYIKRTLNRDVNQASQHSQFSQAQTAKIAAEKALAQAGIDKSQIGLVIAGGCAPEYQLPANACVMAAEIGIKAPGLDIGSACSTFAAHMHTLNMMGDNLPDYVLLIQAENWTRTIDFSDRKTAVLIGDATVATVVSNKHPAKMQIKHTCLESDPSGWLKVQTPVYGHFAQDGPAVQKFAIKKTIATVERLKALSDLSLENHYFIGHQANLTMLKSVAEKLGIEANKHLYNVDKFGNCASAGGPSVLSMNIEKFKLGDIITVAVVGAGLTWGGLVIEVVA